MRNLEWTEDAFLNLDLVESYEFYESQIDLELSRAGIYDLVLTVDMTSGSQFIIKSPKYVYDFALAVDKNKGLVAEGDTLQSLAYASLQYYNRIDKENAE